MIKPITKPPYLYLGFLGLGIGLHYSVLPLHIFGPLAPIGLVAGALLVLAGALLVLWGVRTLVASEVDPRFKPVATIVSSGPYRYTRNPMYVAFTIIYGGVALAVNTVWPLIFLPFLLVLMYYGVIRREERYLEATFGDTYRDYRSRVRRWI